MATQAKIYNKFNNEWFELVFNESFLLLNRDEDVVIVLPDDLHKWKIRIIFDSNINLSPYPIKPEIVDDVVIFKLINWYSDTGVYNSEPIVLNSQSGKFSILTVIKSIANRVQNQRTLMLSIWKKLPPMKS